MKNFVSIVVLTGLVIVQGSSVFEQVIKNVNRNNNEGNKAQKVSRDILKLTGDTSDLEIKDNRNAIGASPIGDKRKREFDIMKWLVMPLLSIDRTIEGLKKFSLIRVDANGQVLLVLDAIGNIADITFTIVKLPFSLDKGEDLIHIVPEILSVEKDLEGIVQCHDHKCTIDVLGLNITAGYNPVPILGIFDCE